MFNVGKCDRIFDELLKNGNIKINHTVPSADELKRRAYCKWHNSFSLATNDCNVFRRQIQSAINEGRLKFQEMRARKSWFGQIQPIKAKARKQSSAMLKRLMGIVKFLAGKWWPRRLPMEGRP
jgi:hypothetical protein